jgi:hypothetical protein
VKAWNMCKPVIVRQGEAASPVPVAADGSLPLALPPERRLLVGIALTNLTIFNKTAAKREKRPSRHPYYIESRCFFDPAAHGRQH